MGTIYSVPSFFFLHVRWHTNFPVSCLGGYPFGEKKTKASIMLEEHREMNDFFNKFDFRYPQSQVKVLLDSPFENFFWDYYMTYPNAKFLWLYRDPTEWTDRRRNNHHMQ